MTKNPHAVALGKLGGQKGGKAKSPAKTAAARANAKLPRKKVQFFKPPTEAEESGVTYAGVPLKPAKLPRKGKKR